MDNASGSGQHGTLLLYADAFAVVIGYGPNDDGKQDDRKKIVTYKRRWRGIRGNAKAKTANPLPSTKCVISVTQSSNKIITKTAIKTELIQTSFALFFSSMKVKKKGKAYSSTKYQ